MTEIKNDQYSQQTVNDSGQQSKPNNADSRPDKMTIQAQEIEEWDVAITDQRRPQFRSSENYGRRNF